MSIDSRHWFKTKHHIAQLTQEHRELFKKKLKRKIKLVSRKYCAKCGMHYRKSKELHTKKECEARKLKKRRSEESKHHIAQLTPEKLYLDKLMKKEVRTCAECGMHYRKSKELHTKEECATQKLKKRRLGESICYITICSQRRETARWRSSDTPRCRSPQLMTTHKIEIY